MFWTVTQSLLTGLATTFEIFILTLIFALPLGLVLAFGLLSKFKPLQRLVQILVWIIRGTPLMLQLIIIFYGPGLWLHTTVWSGNESGRITATVVHSHIKLRSLRTGCHHLPVPPHPHGLPHSGYLRGCSWTPRSG